MFTERDMLLKKDLKVEIIHPCAPEQYLCLPTEIDRKYKFPEQMEFMKSDKKPYSFLCTVYKIYFMGPVLFLILNGISDRLHYFLLNFKRKKKSSGHVSPTKRTLNFI